MKSDQKLLFDNHNRRLNYLRLGVTDKCNLRCHYCMPEDMCFAKQSELLSIPEMKRLVAILVKLGISKIRLTGGEPFLRKGIMEFMFWLRNESGIKNIHITSNGTKLKEHIKDLKTLEIDSINLSLDSLSQERFFEITKRDALEPVLESIQLICDANISVKINMVVMPGINIEEIIPMLYLANENDLSIRYIEQMPFNGKENKVNEIFDYKQIIQLIKDNFKNVVELENEKFSTSYNYKIKGFKGTFGVIPAFSRTICSACNRIRITPQGTLKTCLYDNGVLDIKALLRNNSSDTIIEEAFLNAFQKRSKDGFEAANKAKRDNTIYESMSTIGG